MEGRWWDGSAFDRRLRGGKCGGHLCLLPLCTTKRPLTDECKHIPMMQSGAATRELSGIIS